MTACHDVAVTSTTAGIRRVALIGSPNAGKTSVFNHLTGLRAKTGNYPGVTVGRSVGTTTVDGVAIAVEDLPGTYSLDPISPDEQVVTDLLAGRYSDIDRPDALVLVADATTLRRSIMLVGQVLRLDLPCLLALTMGDELTSRGGRIDVGQSFLRPARKPSGLGGSRCLTRLTTLRRNRIGAPIELTGYSCTHCGGPSLSSP
jgi:ferrous iron transport protein B